MYDTACTTADVILDKNAVKEDADAIIVAEELGIDILERKGKKLILCPLHDDHNFGSCFLNERGFDCYSCHKHGDVFTLVQAKMKVGFRQAVRIVAEINGGVARYTLSSEETQLRLEEAKYISEDDRRFIELDSSPVYTEAGIVYDYDMLNDLREDGFQIDYADDASGELLGYSLKKRVEANPLYSLYKEDFESYQKVIDNRCSEKIRNLEFCLKLIENPEQLPEYQGALQRLFSCAPKSDWLLTISRMIRRARNISLTHGMGLAHGDNDVPEHQRANSDVVATANSMWKEKAGVPF